MRVVGRGAVFRVVLGIPRVGAPFGLPRAKRIVDIAALVVAVNLIGEGRGKKNEWRGGDTRTWQDIDRHDVLLAAAAQTHPMGAGGHGAGNRHVEIRLPAAIVQIIFVEMDRAIVPGPVAPVHLLAIPMRSANRSRWQVPQGAVERERAAVADALAVDLL